MTTILDTINRIPENAHVLTCRQGDVEWYSQAVPSLQAAVEVTSDMFPPKPQRTWANVFIPKSSHAPEKWIHNLIFPSTLLILSRISHSASAALACLRSLLFPVTILLDSLTILPRIALVACKALCDWKWGKKDHSLAHLLQDAHLIQDPVQIEFYVRHVFSDNELALEATTLCIGEFSPKRGKITSRCGIQPQRIKTFVYRKLDNEWNLYDPFAHKPEREADIKKWKELQARYFTLHGRIETARFDEVKAACHVPGADRIFNFWLFDHVADPSQSPS